MITLKNKKSLASLVIIILIFVVAVMYIWLHACMQERTAFENHFLDIMKNLNSTETRTEVISWFEKDYNFTENYEWVNEKLEFIPTNVTFERHTDPSEILESGKGRCEEFSILYVAACLAHGYQSRIIVAVDVSNPIKFIGHHVWAEVRLDGWVHVDPSDRVWNEPYRYEGWFWGKDIGSKVKIYAFEDVKIEDITLNYKQED